MTTQENQSEGEEKCALCGAPAGKRHSDGYACFTPSHPEVEGDWRDGFAKIWFNKKYIDSNGRTIKTDLYFALLAYFSHLLAEREKREIEFLEKLNSAADTVTCDCGELYKDSVLADLIYERISQFNN